MIDFKGAIFDADGTLLNSMPIWDNTAGKYLISQGITPRPTMKEDLVSMGGHELPNYFLTEYGLDKTYEEIRCGISKMLEDFYFNKAPIKDGVITLLDLLRGRGIKMCVATATDRNLMEPALKRLGLYKYFERIFTCSEEQTTKRSPDIFIRAAEFLGTPISQTLIFEDALYAIKSAKDAGFPVVAVYDLWADAHQEEIKSLCDYYYHSLADAIECF